MQGTNISCAEMPGGVDHYRCAGDTDSIDAGDICVRLSSCRANANGVGLSPNTFVADIDIVIARGEIQTGAKAQGDITVTCVAIERQITVGGVVVAGDVEIERVSTVGRVAVAGFVATSARSPLAVLSLPV